MKHDFYGAILVDWCKLKQQCLHYICVRDDPYSIMKFVILQTEDRPTSVRCQSSWIW